ncbi:hypothetical protein GPK74_05410 [Coprococcus catus]|uniref:DUF6591 domain-containing protein n=1 Tax=Coprococcus catus TaxID=116085 RepID=UPI001C031748|nr:DUF6591 domain-containing protein [Coprococcus catus]MBT9769408.1 hypothetical protein [Coprococcus catus]
MNMNKKVKIFIILAVILSMVVCFAGCGNIETPNNLNSNTTKEKINIEDISWNVNEGIVDGDHYVLLNYTNNTQYTITNFKLTFTEKTGITEEEKVKFYSDIQEKFEASDKDMESIKSQPISMHAETGRVVNPSETASNINCYYYSGSFYLKDINYYNLVEPDIATIKYIDEDKIFTVYYDYGSKKYSAESETEVAYQWSQTDLGSKIPKPDVKVVESDRDDEIIFMFNAYGLSLDQFNAYVEECKVLGYTVDPGNFEGFYSADNTEGYNVYLYYNKKDDSMNGAIRAPETKSE